MKNSKTERWILLAVLLAAVAALAVGITLAVTYGTRPACACCAQGGTARTGAEEAQPTQAQTEPVGKDAASIAIPGFDGLNLTADTREQSLPLYNPQENVCYFRISLLLDGETLWRSELLAPGQSVSRQTLSRTLAAGTYSAVLKYACFADEGETTPLNGSEIGLYLHVQ